MTTDRARTGYRLKIPAGRFEQYVVGVIMTAQFMLGLGAVLMLGFWGWFVLGSWYHPWLFRGGLNMEYFSIDWYPALFAMGVVMALIVVLLHYLYEPE